MIKIGVGDQILARSRALVCGEQYDLGDPTSWNPYDYNRIGNRPVFLWRDVDDYHLTLCTVIAVVKFPDEAHNLSHFHVLLGDGRLAKIFDNRLNGFWLRVEFADIRAKGASTQAWYNGYPRGNKLGHMARYPTPI